MALSSSTTLPQVCQAKVRKVLALINDLLGEYVREVSVNPTQRARAMMEVFDFITLLQRFLHTVSSMHELGDDLPVQKISVTESIHKGESSNVVHKKGRKRKPSKDMESLQKMDPNLVLERARELMKNEHVPCCHCSLLISGGGQSNMGDEFVDLLLASALNDGKEVGGGGDHAKHGTVINVHN